MNLFQAFQSVLVTDEELECHGQAGHVIAQAGDTITVEMDVDGEHLEFKAAQLRGL